MAASLVTQPPKETEPTLPRTQESRRRQPESPDPLLSGATGRDVIARGCPRWCRDYARLLCGGLALVELPSLVPTTVDDGPTRMV